MKKICALILLSTALPLCAEMFRGDPQHSGLYSGAGPTGAPRIAWRFATKSAVRSSPVATSDTIYAGSDDGNLYAIDRATGAKRWERALGGAVNGSPATGDRLIYVTSRNGYVNAIEMSGGKLRWRVPIGLNVKPARFEWEYFESSPTLNENKLYVGGLDGRLYVLNAASGSTVWKSEPLGDSIHSTPAIAGDLVIVGSDAGSVFAFDRNSGAQRWKFDTEGTRIDLEKAGFDRRSIYSSPAIHGDLVVIGARDGWLYGISLADGRERWRVDHHVFWVIGSAAMWNDLALVGTSDGKNFEAIDASGQMKWTHPLGDRVFASAAVADGVAYFGAHDGSLWALDAATGRDVWRFWIGAGITSSPVIRDGQLYVGADDGFVYAIKGSAAAPPLHRAVIWQDVPALWFAEGAKLRDYAVSAGYENVDATRLAAFMHERIADREPSVVIFGNDRVPSTTDDELLRQYLETGGTIAWSGLPPFSVVFDEATGKPKAFDPEHASRFLGLPLRPRGHDDLAVQPTAAGTALGLTTFWIGGGGIDPANVETVLATDIYGRAVTWSKRFGAGSFLMMGGSPRVGMPLGDFIRLAESGASR